MKKKQFNLPWGLIKKFFKELFDKKNKKISGELSVVGKDFVEIELQHGEPKKIKVKFLDEALPNPCDPGSQDTYAWSVKRDCCHTYVLSIYWNVSAQRLIGWEVKF